MREGLAFPSGAPNAETRAAIEESRAGANLIEAVDVPELLSKLLTTQEGSLNVD